MQVVDQKVWDDWKAKNEDPYGAAIFRYAETWADLMEKRMAVGAVLEDIAQETSHEADTEGITGFMYGAAVATLVLCWVHGERLKAWHNGEYGKPDAEGVVNPAMLVLGEE